MIICDSTFGGGCFLKQMTKIPVVCSHSSFAMSQAPVPKRMLVSGFHPQLDHCHQILKRICESYKIEEPSLEQVFTSKGDLNIVYTTRNFNGDEGVHEPDYLFAGPSIDRLQDTSDLDFSVIGNRKLIYISLGSLNTEFIDFYKTCISAFRNTVYYVCMSIGRKYEASQLGEIPPNFLVKSYLPQLEILKRADVFITHAGFNSVNEALYFGVPMLALPQINDQHMVAKRLVSMQLGMTESIKELSSEILSSKTETLIMEREIKDNCTRISQEMRNFAKLEQTVWNLEKYVEAWKERR
jgi:MGT family glycosyltransferase